MQQVIIYRSPLEAMFWEGIMSGALLPVFVGLAVFLIVIVQLDKRGGGWKNKNSNRNIAISAVLAFAAAYVVFKWMFG